MGTLVMQLRTSFKILSENKRAVLAAIKKMPGKERDLDICPDNHFAYIDFEPVDNGRRYLFEDSETLEAALRQWHWFPKNDELGNIVDLAFYGLCDGDYDILFAVIAPWIEPGSYVEMVNEEGCRFRFNFQNGKVSEVNLKKISGVDGHWDRFWSGKIVKRFVVSRHGKEHRVLNAEIKRNLSLEFTGDEIDLQVFREVVLDEDAYIFAPQGRFVYLFRVETKNSTQGQKIPLLYFICKI